MINGINMEDMPKGRLLKFSRITKKSPKAMIIFKIENDPIDVVYREFIFLMIGLALINTLPPEVKAKSNKNVMTMIDKIGKFFIPFMKGTNNNQIIISR